MPEKDSEPRVGRVKPEADAKSVVLPEPLRPAKAHAFARSDCQVQIA